MSRLAESELPRSLILRTSPNRLFRKLACRILHSRTFSTARMAPEGLGAEWSNLHLIGGASY